MAESLRLCNNVRHGPYFLHFKSAALYLAGSDERAEHKEREIGAILVHKHTAKQRQDHVRKRVHRVEHVLVEIVEVQLGLGKVTIIRWRWRDEYLMRQIKCAKEFARLRTHLHLRLESAGNVVRIVRAQHGNARQHEHPPTVLVSSMSGRVRNNGA